MWWAQRAINETREETAVLPEMTLDEINVEISAVRVERDFIVTPAEMMELIEGRKEEIYWQWRYKLCIE